MIFYNCVGEIMKKIIMIILKVLMVVLVLSWILLVVAESNRYKNDEPMIITLSEKIIDYTDGSVHVYYGLGYKKIIYQRTSLEGKEFGNIFIKVKEELPKK